MINGDYFSKNNKEDSELNNNLFFHFDSLKIRELSFKFKHL